MPRLVIDKDLPAPVMAGWTSYLAPLEARQAAQLRFAFVRMDTVERAIRASSCGRAQAAGDAALVRLQEQQRLAFKPDARNQPKLELPQEYEKGRCLQRPFLVPEFIGRRA